MNDVEIVKQCLDTILKKGDLYDAIAEREGVKLQKHSFIRHHVLLFSRILYGGVRAYEKVKSLFSPVEEVKRAQDQIRRILGVNVDFVKTKHQFDLYTDLSSAEGKSLKDAYYKYEKTKNPELSILYENANIRIEEYVEHLKRILTFCELYNIREVFLRESDIVDSFPELNLENYPHTTMKGLLDSTAIQISTNENDQEDIQSRNNYNIDGIYSLELLQLNRSSLRSLISELDIVKVSKQVVSSFGKLIEDITVKNAIIEFLQKGNLEKLKAIVSSRLALLINGDSSYRDKNYGKVFQSITIKDEYINVVSMNKDGEVISNVVTTLYDYLEILDYKSLLKQIKIKGDNQEILAMAALQLYLCQSIKIKGLDRESTSFYDYIYHHYKAKKKGKVKRIPGLYTKSDKRLKSCVHLFSNALITLLLVAVILITGVSVEFIEQIAFDKEPEDVFDNILDTMVNPYLKSLDFERGLVEQFIDFTDGIRVDFSNFLKSFSGDAEEGLSKSDTVVATVTTLEPGYTPTYFATGYATSATYNSGKMEYTIEQPLVDFNDLQDSYPVLEISMPFSTYALNKAIDNNEFKVPKLFYPLGNSYALYNYELISITIYDELDTSKVFVMDSYRNSLTGSHITDYEIEMLRSMAMPRMVYEYGINNGLNPFIEDLEKKESYTENPPEIIRQAIIDGLGLEETASDYDIYSAIVSKEYSLTPIKDAKLTRKIKKLNEEKYFKTVASMDSLICNLAATLAVGTDEDLIYTVGYLSDDEYIRENEAHAWAMRKDGYLLDITPSASNTDEKEEDTFIQKLFAWGLENHIPLYALIAYIGYEADKILGRRIRFRIKVQKIAKRLTSPETEESYAKLREALYGGVNIPCKRPPLDLLEAIERDFGGFTQEELKKLKNELLQRDLNGSGELDLSLDLMQKAPFIKENSDKVKKMLMKKMQK